MITLGLNPPQAGTHVSGLHSKAADCARDSLLDQWDNLNLVEKLRVGALCAPGQSLAGRRIDLFQNDDEVDSDEQQRALPAGAVSKADKQRAVISLNHDFDSGAVVIVLNDEDKLVYGRVDSETKSNSFTYVIETTDACSVERYVTAIAALPAD